MLKKILVAIGIGIAWVISVLVMALILPPAFIWVQYKMYREAKERRARLERERRAELATSKGVQSA